MSLGRCDGWMGLRLSTRGSPPFYSASSSRFSSSVSPMSATSAPCSSNSLSSALLASASEPAAEPAPSRVIPLATRTVWSTRVVGG